MKGKASFLTSIIAATVLVMVGLLAGCSSDETSLTTASQTGVDDFEQLDLNLDYGGLTTSDEEIAFGDEVLKAMLLAEDQEVVVDPLANDPRVLDMEERGRHTNQYGEGERPRFTYLRLRWGMLRGLGDVTVEGPPCDMTDWTGTLRTDRGLVVVKRQIKFEFPADHVVFPRLDHQTVAFVSHTWCHFDGLLIQIIEPPADDSARPEVANKLYIDTPAYQGEFLVSELAGLDEVIEVDESGNKIHLNGFGLEDIEACPKGFVSGRYRHLPQDDAASLTADGEAQRFGSFAGAWMSLNGRLRGFMRGGYGMNADGERVFVGKLIDRRGNFQGLLRGAWDPTSDSRDLGEFQGRWVTRRGQVEGILGGRAHPVEGYPGGFYEGRWTTLCDEEAEGLVN